jgi:ABC-type branched-subunit amino acid transport system ATPase component
MSRELCTDAIAPRAAETLFVSLREINRSGVAILLVERM